jgi:hypothetical protein
MCISDEDMIGKILPIAFFLCFGAAFTTAQSVKAWDGWRDGPFGLGGKRAYLYYTASAKQLFMRVKVDPISFNPVGEVEVVGGGRIFDDFWIDQDAGFAYLTTHPQNTMDRLALEPSQNGSEILIIAGNPFNDELIGPTAGHWGRGRDEYGRVAFIATDGGTASPPAGGARPAKVMKAEFTTKSILSF